MPTSGDFTPWAKQGLLLLNTVLTVREGEPNSHRGRGWEPLTEAVLRVVDAQPERVVFLCLGRQAQQMAERSWWMRTGTPSSTPRIPRRSPVAASWTRWCVSAPSSD